MPQGMASGSELPVLGPRPQAKGTPHNALRYIGCCCPPKLELSSCPKSKDSTYCTGAADTHLIQSVDHSGLLRVASSGSGCRAVAYHKN